VSVYTAFALGVAVGELVMFAAYRHATRTDRPLLERHVGVLVTYRKGHSWRA
jgi:hypothetical protein